MSELPQNTILIVDDVPRNIQVVANVLNNKKYKLLFSQSPTKAIQIVKGKEIDLILLDVMMPEMNGYNVCREIKKIQDKKDIPIIFLTAKNDIESVTKGFEAGGSDYITKPFNNNELLARVNNHLNMRNAFKVIQKQNEELNELNQSKDKFFSIIAHDLRNPFNAIYMLSEVLHRKAGQIDTDEARNIIEMLFVSSKEVYELLDNLLTWSRVQRNKLEYFPENQSINKIVEANYSLYQSIAQSKDISISVVINSQIEIKTDRNMLNTILRNLITNAIKFTHEGGRVAISAEEHDEHVKFSVKDTGVGMTQEQIGKLLSDNKIKSQKGTADEMGTGIGLALCKEFTERLEGKLWIESTPGRGSTFYFTIKK